VAVLLLCLGSPSLGEPPRGDWKQVEGFYRMWQLDRARTKVVYQVEADVGGSVPRWMAERVARDMPYETLSRLRQRVASSIAHH
jgi:hypothetical protein